MVCLLLQAWNVTVPKPEFSMNRSWTRIAVCASIFTFTAGCSSQEEKKAGYLKKREQLFRKGRV